MTIFCHKSSALLHDIELLEIPITISADASKKGCEEMMSQHFISSQPFFSWKNRRVYRTAYTAVSIQNDYAAVLTRFLYLALKGSLTSIQMPKVAAMIAMRTGNQSPT